MLNHITFKYFSIVIVVTSSLVVLFKKNQIDFIAHIYILAKNLTDVQLRWYQQLSKTFFEHSASKCWLIFYCIVMLIIFHALIIITLFTAWINSLGFSLLIWETQWFVFNCLRWLIITFILLRVILNHFWYILFLYFSDIQHPCVPTSFTIYALFMSLKLNNKQC